MKILTLGLIFLVSIAALATEEDNSSYNSLKNHKVLKVVEGRWQGLEKNEHFLKNHTEYIQRDFRIGPNLDQSKLVFESLIPEDNYIGYFSYYNEDCLQYDEYGYIQHLCMGPSGYVAWSGPCSAGSYRTRMTRITHNNQEILVKYGDHWNHQGKLHRRNTAEFVKIKDLKN